MKLREHQKPPVFPEIGDAPERSGKHPKKEGRRRKKAEEKVRVLCRVQHMQAERERRLAEENARRANRCKPPLSMEEYLSRWGKYEANW